MGHIVQITSWSVVVHPHLVKIELNINKNMRQFGVAHEI